MFTIDLLKGQGIPIKSRPEGIAIAAAIFTVPVIIAIVMFGFYLSNIVAISIQRQKIVNYGAKIAELSGAVKLQKSLEKEKIALSSSLAEVKSSVGRHTQWSPVLVTLVRNMPDSVILTGLELKQRSISKKVPVKDDPKKTTIITVPVRTLRMTVSGSPQSNCDRAVRDFRDSLRSSSLLGPKLQDIKVSQESGMLGDQDVVSYEIDCIFKPEL